MENGFEACSLGSMYTPARPPRPNDSIAIGLWLVNSRSVSEVQSPIRVGCRLAPQRIRASGVRWVDGSQDGTGRLVWISSPPVSFLRSSPLSSSTCTVLYMQQVPTQCTRKYSLLHRLLSRRESSTPCKSTPGSAPASPSNRVPYRVSTPYRVAGS